MKPSQIMVGDDKDNVKVDDFVDDIIEDNAIAVDSDEQNGWKGGHRFCEKRRCFYISSALCFLIGIVVAVVIFISIQQAEELSTSTTLNSSMTAVPSPPPEAITEEEENQIRATLAPSNSATSTILEPTTTTTTTIDPTSINLFSQNNSPRRDSVASILKVFFPSDEFPSSPFQIQAMDWLVEKDSWPSPFSVKDFSSTMLLERYVATLFYFATKGEENWKEVKYWTSSESVCDWEGIQCDFDRQIISIEAYDRGISGVIPTEVGKLTNLESLSLERNQVSGTIPTNFKMLTDLRLCNLCEFVILK